MDDVGAETDPARNACTRIPWSANELSISDSGIPDRPETPSGTGSASSVAPGSRLDPAALAARRTCVVSGTCADIEPDPAAPGSESIPTMSSAAVMPKICRSCAIAQATAPASFPAM